MALKDVKKYYQKTQDTYLRCKENESEMINEYREGNITQEQLENYQKYVTKLQINYDRLSYVMYLLNIPTRKDKKDKYNKNNNKLVSYFKGNNATQEDVEYENKNILTKLQKIIKGAKLMKEIKEFLNTLGITEVPELENNTCTVFLRDSDVYEKIFEKLENMDELTQDDVQVTDEENLITYYGKGLYITLDAQFNEDLYTLKVDKTDFDYEKEGE